MQEEECEEADGGTSVADRDPENPDLADLADPAPVPNTFKRRLLWYRGRLERVFFGRWLLGMPPLEKEAARAKWQSFVGGGPQYDCEVLRSFGNVWLRQNRQGRPGVAFGGPKPTMYCTTFLAGLCW